MNSIVIGILCVLGVGLAIMTLIRLFWFFVEIFWEWASQLVAWGFLAIVLIGWFYLLQYNNSHPIFG